MFFFGKKGFVVVVQGAVLCARFCVDSPYVLAVGGTRNGFQTLDIRGLVPGMFCLSTAWVLYNSRTSCLSIAISPSLLALIGCILGVNCSCFPTSHSCSAIQRQRHDYASGS